MAATSNSRGRRTDQLRVPPCDILAEQSVLGACLLTPAAYERIGDMLDPEMFYRRDHQLIYQAIQHLAERNQPFDTVTLGEWFEAQGQSELIGGGGYLIELSTTTPSAANVVAYARIVRDKFQLRQLIEVGTNIVNTCFNPEGMTPEDVIGQAERDVMDVAHKHVAGAATAGKAGLKRTVAEMKRRMESNDGLLGITTSVSDLDAMILGLQPSDLIILAARPSMGKTAFMLQMARTAAHKGKNPLTISMEMSQEQLYMRHLAAEGRIDFKHVQNPQLLEDDETTRMQGAFASLEKLEWWVDDSPSVRVERLCARIRKAVKQHKHGIVFIDYLQFIDLGPDGLRNTAGAVQNVTRLLKALAKELRIPIVLLSQLNRSLEARADKRPAMSDLRDSGAIEQDADVIIFLHREAYYHGKDWDVNDERHTIAEAIVAKSRNGETGSIRMRWLGRYQQFGNITREEIPAEYRELEERRNERPSGRSVGFDRHRENRLRTKGPSGGRAYED